MIDTNPGGGRLNWVLYIQSIPLDSCPGCPRFFQHLINLNVPINVTMSTTTTQLEHGISESYELSNHSPRLSPTQQQALGSESPPEKIPDRRTYLKLVSVAFSFFVAGVNDGSIGALVPYIIRDYGVNTAIVSSVYVPSISSLSTS